MANAIYQEVTTLEERQQVKFTIGDLPGAIGDPAMMRQVWMNLISNALKFSANRGQAVISVSFKEEESKLIYCIKDNGAGFNMKYNRCRRLQEKLLLKIEGVPNKWKDGLLSA